MLLELGAKGDAVRLTVSNCSLNPTTMKADGTSIWRRLRTAMMSEPPRCG